MAKTLMVARHEAGPAENGHDGCFARTGNNGCCPGVQTAKWLNGLGYDDELYLRQDGEVITNGKVRINWLNENAHVIALVPRRAQLVAEKNRLASELRRVNRELKRLA